MEVINPSLELPGMYALCSLRKLNDCLGDGEKRILKEEEKNSKKLRYWRKKSDLCL